MSRPASVEEGATGSVEEVFTELAAIAAPMPIYGWTEVPSGMDVAPRWLPVVEEQDPAAYDGPAFDNPRVSGTTGTDPEIRLVLTYNAGWLEVVENFRGDLGDVAGSAGGRWGWATRIAVRGHGGHPGQWSDGGRWYGVFARQVAAQELVPLALSMKPVSAGGSR